MRKAETGAPTKPRLTKSSEESATLVVKDSPYVSVSDKDGKFTIANLPEGEWTFQVWHGNYIRTVKITGQIIHWNKGQFDQKIKAGENDLGQIQVPPTEFK